MNPDRARMLRALEEYISDMDEIVSVRQVLGGLWVVMASGAEIHVGISLMKLGRSK